MAFKWIPWLMANEFVHIRAFMQPLLGDESIPKTLRRRVRKRIRSGLRLVKIRAGLYAIMFSAVITLLAGMVFLALEEVLAEELVGLLRSLFAIVMTIVSPLALVAVIGVFVVERAMKLLKTDIYILSMEAVVLGAKAGAPMPSGQSVKLVKKKRRKRRSGRS